MSNQEGHSDVTILESGQPCTAVEVLEPRLVPLGGPRAMTVCRTSPQRERSLIRAWCFLDHYGPDSVAETGDMTVPRHLHTGLATVSWLFAGEIAHQEISAPQTDALHGVQLWYALPQATRFSANHFVRYKPQPITIVGLTAHVFIGDLLGSKSAVDPAPRSCLARNCFWTQTPRLP
ncbi:pirin family protein [Jonesiaceae bacterium BS-20]|uniref:Pirin family protein n=1 Tax=Jonesiaceae bacterium BS-20 TaxID=3120821 RepID=A0AAU7DUR1_9MICO